MDDWLRMQVTSQHPYAEDFIGEPHVYTVDAHDKDAVDSAVKKALRAFDNGQVTENQLTVTDS